MTDDDLDTHLRQLLHDELAPIREAQDRLMRQNAALVHQLAQELDDTRRALAATRGALIGHAQGMSHCLYTMFHPAVKAAVYAATVLIASHYCLKLWP